MHIFVSIIDNFITKNSCTINALFLTIFFYILSTLTIYIFRKAETPVLPYIFDMKLIQDQNVTSGLNDDFLAVNDLTYDQLVNKYDLVIEFIIM